MKQFKFFDIYNAGTLNFDNFYRTAEKIGIIKDKEEVYQYYQHLNGVDASGNIDYRVFAKSLFSDDQNKEQSRPGTTYSPSKKGTFDDIDDGVFTADHEFFESKLVLMNAPQGETIYLHFARGYVNEDETAVGVTSTYSSS